MAPRSSHPGGLEPAVGALDVGDAELVDMTVEGIGDAAHMPADAKEPFWHWQHCLRRRSQRHRLTWRKMMRIAERWLPSPKLRHPYPDWRFDVMTRGGEPGALAAHAGIYTGAERNRRPCRARDISMAYNNISPCGNVLNCGFGPVRGLQDALRSGPRAGGNVNVVVRRDPAIPPAFSSSLMASRTVAAVDLACTGRC
jgi:hypothetical protein